jgi:hypothetical protein
VDKKYLIGVSICAVVLLVLSSLSNVVGYQSVKSTVNDSPLFQTRTQRATNQQTNSITSRYLGMGKENLLQFPIRDNNNALMKTAIEIISKMDNKTFERFTEFCIQGIRQDKSLRDANLNDIVKTLYVLKTKRETIINSFINKNNRDITSSGLNTICIWFLGCIPYYIITLPFMILLMLIGLYLETHPTTGPGCWSHNYLCLAEENQ